MKLLESLPETGKIFFLAQVTMICQGQGTGKSRNFVIGVGEVVRQLFRFRQHKVKLFKFLTGKILRSRRGRVNEEKSGN